LQLIPNILPNSLCLSLGSQQLLTFLIGRVSITDINKMEIEQNVNHNINNLAFLLPCVVKQTPIPGILELSCHVKKVITQG